MATMIPDLAWRVAACKRCGPLADLTAEVAFDYREKVCGIRLSCQHCDNAVTVTIEKGCGSGFERAPLGWVVFGQGDKTPAQREADRVMKEWDREWEAEDG